MADPNSLNVEGFAAHWDGPNSRVLEGPFTNPTTSPNVLIGKDRIMVQRAMVSPDRRGAIAKLREHVDWELAHARKVTGLLEALQVRLIVEGANLPLTRYGHDACDCPERFEDPLA